MTKEEHQWAIDNKKAIFYESGNRTYLYLPVSLDCRCAWYIQMDDVSHSGGRGKFSENFKQKRLATREEVESMMPYRSFITLDCVANLTTEVNSTLQLYPIY